MNQHDQPLFTQQHRRERERQRGDIVIISVCVAYHTTKNVTHNDDVHMSNMMGKRKLVREQ